MPRTQENIKNAQEVLERLDKIKAESEIKKDTTQNKNKYPTKN